MQFFALALLAISASASLVARQSPYPDCANSCIANADLGNCISATNVLCLCNSPAFVSGTTTCIESACQGADLQKAISVSQSICEAVGVTLTSTPASTPTSTSSGSSSTPTSPSSSSSGTGSSSSNTTSSTPSSSNTTSPTSSSSNTTSPTSSNSTSSAPTTTTTTSAAAPARVVNGLVVLGAAALLALAL